MILFPAIDLFGGKAVRLLKGDYNQMTVYHEHPEEVANTFFSLGATHIHMVDLEGARCGEGPNRDLICHIAATSPCFVQVGGGIRSLDVIKHYLENGVDRVILGTAAVEQPGFAEDAVKRYGDKIAVGVDIADGYVAVHGWQKNSGIAYEGFCEKMQKIGVKTLIVTDISRDGAMKGTNLSLYKTLSERYSMQIIASGGVSNLKDIENLKNMSLYGAIIGKAYYTKAIDLKEAVEIAGDQTK